MSGRELLAALIGIFAPVAAAYLKKLGLSRKKQDMVILVALIAVAGVMAVGSGEISTNACAGLGLEACFGVVYKYIGLVVGGAFVSYKMFWQASGIDDEIAGK